MLIELPYLVYISFIDSSFTVSSTVMKSVSITGVVRAAKSAKPKCFFNQLHTVIIQMLNAKHRFDWLSRVVLAAGAIKVRKSCAV